MKYQYLGLLVRSVDLSAVLAAASLVLASERWEVVDHVRYLCK